MQYTVEALERLWRITLSGPLADRDLLELQRLIMEIDESTSVAPNLLIDLRALSHMDFDYRTVSDLARALGNRSLTNIERVALLAAIPIQYGFARMFQMLSENRHVEVRVFENENNALDWLSHRV
jgi:hypothetical protein